MKAYVTNLLPFVVSPNPDGRKPFHAAQRRGGAGACPCTVQTAATPALLAC
jgi:hypothetical protein